eukprot:ANDGO_08262.mRNA.1 hypothetical protein
MVIIQHVWRCYEVSRGVIERSKLSPSISRSLRGGLASAATWYSDHAASGTCEPANRYRWYGETIEQPSFLLHIVCNVVLWESDRDKMTHLIRTIESNRKLSYTKSDDARIERAAMTVSSLISLGCFVDEIRCSQFWDAMAVERDAFYILLDMPITVGSSDLRIALPPSFSDCLLAARMPYSQSPTCELDSTSLPPGAAHSGVFANRNVLTVAGRALSKHAHRDASTAFWGVIRGPASAVSNAAEGVLRRILGAPAWFNLHKLPHDESVFEIRDPGGYGARWVILPSVQDPADVAQLTACSTVSFRGFLEPPMPNGHEAGWRH